MVSGWELFRQDTHTGTAVQLLQRTPELRVSRGLQSCLQTFEVLFADLSHTAFTRKLSEGEQSASRDPEGEPGSERARTGAPGPAGSGSPGPGHSARRAWDRGPPVGRRG